MAKKYLSSKERSENSHMVETKRELKMRQILKPVWRFWGSLAQDKVEALERLPWLER